MSTNELLAKRRSKHSKFQKLKLIKQLINLGQILANMHDVGEKKKNHTTTIHVQHTPHLLQHTNLLRWETALLSDPMRSWSCQVSLWSDHRRQ